MRDALVASHLRLIRSTVQTSIHHCEAGRPNSLHDCTTSARDMGQALAAMLGDTLIVHPHDTHPAGFRFTTMVLNRNLTEMVMKLSDRPSEEFLEIAKDALTRVDLLLSLADRFEFIEFPKGFAL